MVTAVILAAGQGRRLGGRAKALLTLEGESFLARVAATCRGAGCAEIWVVTPPLPNSTAAETERLGLRVAPNPDPSRGMFSSVHCGLDALRNAEEKTSWALLFPVDHPRVTAKTVRALLDRAAQAPPGTWIQPEHVGRPGHPVLLDPAAVRCVLTWPADSTLRDALRQEGLHRCLVPVDDDGINQNVNVPSDLPNS